MKLQICHNCYRSIKYITHGIDAISRPTMMVLFSENVFMYLYCFWRWEWNNSCKFTTNGKLSNFTPMKDRIIAMSLAMCFIEICESVPKYINRKHPILVVKFQCQSRHHTDLKIYTSLAYFDWIFLVHWQEKRCAIILKFETNYYYPFY